MAQMQEFTVRLSEEAVQFVRGKVSSGEYASESEVICDVITAACDEQAEVEVWLRTEIAARYDAYKANPSSALTHEQVEANLAERRRRRAALSA